MSTARPSWHGVFQFGLLRIPVKLFPAIEGDDKSPFVTLHGTDDGTIKQDKVCATCATTLKTEDCVRAVRTDAGGYARVTNDDLAALATTSRKRVDVNQFAIAGSLRPELVEGFYYAMPDEDDADAVAAYRSFAAALFATNTAGIGKISFQSGEKIAWIGCEGQGLRVYTLRFPSDIRPAPAMDGVVGATGKAVDLSIKLIKATNPGMADLSSYTNDYADKLEALVALKRQGAVTTGKEAQRMTLEQLLTKSVQQKRRAAKAC